MGSKQRNLGAEREAELEIGEESIDCYGMAPALNRIQNTTCPLICRHRNVRSPVIQLCVDFFFVLFIFFTQFNTCLFPR